MIQVKNVSGRFLMKIKKRSLTNSGLSVVLRLKWWNLLTNFIYLGSPLLWHKDDKLYIIGVNILGYEGCKEIKDKSTAKPIYNYIGWILEHVEGEVCGTDDNILDWFDEEDRQDEIRNRVAGTGKTESF